MADEFDLAESFRPIYQQSVEAGKSGLAALPEAQRRAREMEGQTITSGLSFLKDYDKGRADIPMLMGAAALGAPTRTGSFGESMAAGFGAYGGALKQAQAAEMDRFEKMQRLQMAQSALALKPASDSLDQAKQGFGFMGTASSAYEPLAAADLYKRPAVSGAATAPAPAPAPGPQADAGFTVPGATPAPGPVADAAPAVSDAPAEPIQTAQVVDPDAPAPGAAEAQYRPQGAQQAVPELYARDKAILEDYAKNPRAYESSAKGREMVKQSYERFKTSPEYLRQVAEAKRAEGKELSATDRKGIYSGEDTIASLAGEGGVIETLKRARELATKGYDGMGAGMRATIGTKVPGGSLVADEEKAKATAEYISIMGMEAIKSMSENLKGASTDREMAEFQKLLSDPATPNDIKVKTINRMIKAAERKAQMEQERVDQMRGGTYYKPQGGSTGQRQGGAPAPRAPVQIRSDEEYARLPSGAEFVAPDGTIRRKP